MANKLLLIGLLLLSNPIFAETEKISKEVEAICTTKLRVMDWLFTKGETFTVPERLKQWNSEYGKLNKTLPEIFVHTTKVDVERIIREVDRNKDKLVTEEQRNKYMREEMSWCIYYKH